MPQYKLTYFNVTARAEVARMLFALAGQDYEDVRIQKEQWPAMKSTLKVPFQQLPILEIDGGIVLAQSFAIMRYLANEFGYAGKNSLDKARVDMLTDGMADIVPDLGKVFFRSEDKKAALKEVLDNKFPTLFANLERLLIENKGGNGYFVGDSLTWADLMLTNGADILNRFDANFLKKYVKLAALAERVKSNPKIKKWLKNRPETPF